MSTVETQLAGATTAANARKRAADIARVVVVRWEINPDAMRMSPLPEIAAMNGQAKRISRAALVWRVEGGVAAAALRLEIGEDDLVVPLVAGAAAAIMLDGDWRHIEVAGRLVISERRGAVVYARTSVLAELLGLRGGVYELPAVE